jgi:hypothetical protein
MLNYSHVRRHGTNLRRLIVGHLETNSLGDATKADLIGKHFEVLKYELEAVLRLEQWDEIDKLFQV